MNSNAKTPTPGNPKRRLSGALVTLAALALNACSQGPAQSAAQPPLEGAAIGGPFELTASTGERVSWENFRGKYAIVYFGYAYCPDVCPTDMQRTAQGLRILAERDPDLAERMQVVFISIDPERDTPEIVGEFTSAFSDDFIGLTGTLDEVTAVAETFAVDFKRGQETSEGGYLVDHTRIVFLFSPEGAPLAILPADESAEAVANEIEQWAS